MQDSVVTADGFVTRCLSTACQQQHSLSIMGPSLKAPTLRWEKWEGKACGREERRGEKMRGEDIFGKAGPRRYCALAWGVGFQVMGRIQAIRSGDPSSSPGDSTPLKAD